MCRKMSGSCKNVWEFSDQKKIWNSINIHANGNKHSVCAFDSPENGNVEKQMQRKTNRNYGLKKRRRKQIFPEFATCTIVRNGKEYFFSEKMPAYDCLLNFNEAIGNDYRLSLFENCLEIADVEIMTYGAAWYPRLKNSWIVNFFFQKICKIHRTPQRND